jgi:hypothetical protein
VGDGRLKKPSVIYTNEKLGLFMYNKYFLSKTIYLATILSLTIACSSMPQTNKNCDSGEQPGPSQEVDLGKIKEALLENQLLQAQGKSVEYNRTFKSWVRTRANR